MRGGAPQARENDVRPYLDSFGGDTPRLALRTWSGAGPPVVLVHGLTHTLGAWGPLVAHLPSDANVVALDLRSHGQSDAHPDQSYDAYAADVMVAVASAGDDPPLIIGHSWGARVALYAAAQNHCAFRGVVGLDQALWSYEPPLYDFGDHPPPDHIYTDDEHATAVATATTPEESPAWAELVARQFRRVRDGWMRYPPARDGHEMVFAEARSQPLEPLYDQIDCPVMLVFARDDGRDDDDFGYAPPRGRRANVAHLESNYPQLRIEWIDGDHGFYVEHPAELAELLKDFEDVIGNERSR